MPNLGQNAAQVAPDHLLVGCELRDGFIDEDELLRGAAAVGTAFGNTFADLRLDAGDADHKKFIKVIGGNRQESHPFQRGMAGIDQFLQHPAIEMQPGQLAIDEALGAGGDRSAEPSNIQLFFFAFNGLCGFHQVSIHLGARR